MIKANYLGAINGAGEVGQYPLSTEVLDFIQQQMDMLSKANQAFGFDGPTILTSPTNSEQGTLLYNSEVFTIEQIGIALYKGAEYSVCLREVSEDIITSEDVFTKARTGRVAYIAPLESAGSIGKVFAVERNKVVTPFAYTLKQCIDIATHLNVVSSAEFLSSDTVTPDILGTIQLSRQAKWSNTPDGSPISEEDISGARVSTKILDSGEKSFYQEVTTKYGVRFDRLCVASPSTGSVEPYGWRCVPNQVLGTIIIRSDGRGFLGNITMTGIFSGSSIQSGDTSLLFYPKLGSGVRAVNRSVIQVSVIPDEGKDLPTPSSCRARYISGSNLELNQNLAVTIPKGSAVPTIVVTAISI